MGVGLVLQPPCSTAPQISATTVRLLYKRDKVIMVHINVDEVDNAANESATSLDYFGSEVELSSTEIATAVIVRGL